MNKGTISNLFRLNDDEASQQEVIEAIERGVNFQGAKLWILIIAVFVASLGLNTNSAAVIIGAMLISPLMGPIIGMGLGAGIYDFDLLRRSWRNFIIATIFSILTATIYFLITPMAEVQSELLARTSPTIYDVLIALCGGLAGIIALCSRSQRTGNVIPGVAIATALMPPLCTVGFSIATANWAYALGALYLFLINSIFIALATFIGAVFIMKFEKKSYLDKVREKRGKRIIVALALVTVIPSVWLTIGMVRENNFNQHVNQFIQHEMHFPLTQVITHRSDFKHRTLKVVMVGQEVDSAMLQVAQSRLPLYKLDDVTMEVIQGAQSPDMSGFEAALLANSQELHHDNAVISQQKARIDSLEMQLSHFTSTEEMATQLLHEAKVLFPSIESISMARGQKACDNGTSDETLIHVSLKSKIVAAEQKKLAEWLKARVGDEQIQVTIN